MSCPVLKTFFYPMHIHFVASFFRAELCQKNLKRMHNDRINTVWLWRTSQHAKTNGISYECERIIRGVASGPAAGLIAPCARRRSLSLSLSLWRTLFTLTSNFFPLSQQSVEFALGGGERDFKWRENKMSEDSWAVAVDVQEATVPATQVQRYSFWKVTSKSQIKTAHRSLAT